MAHVSPEVQALMKKHYPPETHPYRTLERVIGEHLAETDTVLDIGCGRSAPLLSTLRGRAQKLIGIDLVDFNVAADDLTLLKSDVSDMAGVASNSIDLAYSRSVMEHVQDADRAYAEIARVLKSGGRYVFLTPSFWDYGSLIAYVVPNRLHPMIVRLVEGRPPEDTFPTYYRSNTQKAINRLAESHGFAVEDFRYMGQYPNYLVFNRTLFALGCRLERFIASREALKPFSGWIFCVLRKG